MLQVCRQGAEGAPFEAVVAAESRPEYRRLLEAARGQAAGEVALCRSDGETLHAEVTLGPAPWHRDTIMLTAVDVTRYVREVARLHREKAELEARVQGGAADLAAATVALGAKQQLLDTVLELSADAITVRNAGGRLLLANAAARRMARRTDIEGTPLQEAPAIWGDAFDPAGRPLPVETWPISRALQGERVPAVEWQRALPDGSRLTALNGAAPLRDAAGQVVGALSITTDVTARTLAEEEQRRTALFPEQNPHPVFRLSRDGTVLYANPASRLLLDAWGWRIGVPVPMDACPPLHDTLAAGKTADVEVAHGERIYALTCVPFPGEGYVNVYGRDITDLRQALADKETLLREVHHRTKNNLQMLCDLFYLKAEATASPEVRAALEDGYLRVYGFGRLHHQLYRSMGHGVVHLGDYLRGIVQGFQQIHKEASIRFEAPEEEAHLDLDRTVHCGLLVNELLSNALKHAFPGGAPGEMGLRFRTEGDRAKIQVWDSGVGLRSDPDWEHSTSLGLRIVHMLARRLRATVELETGAGTTFTVRFPLQADLPRDPA
jgi:two-component sensor histidine kinase